MNRLRPLARRFLTGIGFHERRLATRLERDGNRLVLLLHRVLPPDVAPDLSPRGMVLTAPLFGNLLDWLGGRYELPTVDRFLEEYPRPLAKPSALITFDDGWLDVVGHALPEMRKRSVGGVIFASVRHVEEGSLFWPERLIRFIERGDREKFLAVTGEAAPDRNDPERVEALLDVWKKKSENERERILRSLEGEGGERRGERRVACWDELRSLEADGVEIGSHGLTHRLLTGLSPTEIRDEMIHSRERIESAIGRAPRLFAYPNGDRNGEVKRIAEEAGYEYGFSIGGTAGDRFDIPRVNLHDGKMTGRSGRWDPSRLAWSLGSG